MKRLALVAVAALLVGGKSHEDTLGAMQAEALRSTTELSLPGKKAPYYAGYWVVDAKQRNVIATLGALMSDDTNESRVARVEVRVGSRALDNSGFVGGGFMGGGGPGAPARVPMNDAGALRHELWLHTDFAYKDAVETLERKRAEAQSEMQGQDEPASFSKEEPVRLVVEADVPDAPEVEPVDYAKRVSAVFRDFAEIQTSEVEIVVADETRHFVSSEGSEIVVPTPYRGVIIRCAAQADDGMPLSRMASLESVTGGLPPVEDAVERARTVAQELTALRNAPVLEDYSGPVLFEGAAAPQMILELLAEALTGTPAPKGAESLESPLARKLGKRILPTSFDVVDDPTLRELRGQPLLGYYAVDDEGVRPESVSLVERGRLRGFLMSRAPRKDIGQSNGHGRSGLSGWARGRVGNLIVTARGGLPPAALRARLMRAVRDEGSSYGLIVSQLEPRTNGTGGQAIPRPVLAYEVTPDGKRRLVRGATFSQMSVRDLKDILAAGNTPTVYAYSASTPGGFDVPAAVAAPALLFEDVELRRPVTPFKRPPAVSKPSVK